VPLATTAQSEESVACHRRFAVRPAAQPVSLATVADSTTSPPSVTIDADASSVTDSAADAGSALGRIDSSVSSATSGTETRRAIGIVRFSSAPLQPLLGVGWG
jgi:hypothetical protein